MRFKNGDRVTYKNNIRTDLYNNNLIAGTIVEFTQNSDSTFRFVFVNWDKPNHATYLRTFQGISYPNVFGVYSNNLQFFNEAAAVLKNPLPADPRLQKIAIKILDLEAKFANRKGVVYAY